MRETTRKLAPDRVALVIGLALVSACTSAPVTSKPPVTDKPPVVTGGTSVPGGAITTQTWTAAGSPYRILGDVYIPSGHRLTIQPGVEVRFQGHYRLEGPGVIDARGTSATQRDILFTAEDTTAGWYGIRIWNRTGALGVPPDVSDYHLENCIIEYVVKDRSKMRPFGDSSYNDSRGAVYIYGASAWTAGAPENYTGLKYSDVHLNGLMLRHNRALDTSSPKGMGGGLYIISLLGSVQPIWTDVVFDDNQTVDYGGAIAMHHGGAITFRNGAMTNNVATIPEQPGTGGAIGYWDVSGPITLDHVTYSGNVPPGFATAEAPSVIVLNPP
jgi:predicted outer membrane repeat protein